MKRCPAYLIATIVLGLSSCGKPPSSTPQPAPQPSPVPTRPTRPPDKQVKVVRTDGGSIQTALGYGIVVNKESSLHREALTIHDPLLPLTLSESVPVRVTYRADYQYHVTLTATAAVEALSAVEYRFLMFDIWGNSIRTLSATSIRDIPAGTSHEEEYSWRLWSENEASEFYASIAFVARVRTASGRVLEADLQPILMEAQKFSKRFEPANLEPKAPPSPK